MGDRRPIAGVRRGGRRQREVKPRANQEPRELARSVEGRRRRNKRPRAGAQRRQREAKPRANEETKSLTKVKGMKVGTWKGEERLRDKERDETGGLRTEASGEWMERGNYECRVRNEGGEGLFRAFSSLRNWGN